MRTRLPIAAVAAAAAGMVAGCASSQPQRCSTNPAGPPEVRAVYAQHGLRIDGRLDEAVWDTAPAYALSLPADRAGAGDVPQEAGSVRFAWDERHFYMAVEFADSDVVAEGEKDGEHHFAKGDVAELFLWPEPNSWYWELYVTPHDKQSSFFFPGPGRILPSSYQDHLRLEVAAQTQGTFNDWTDRDRGWTAEMAVPTDELTRRGEAWGPEAAWRILVGRYNYAVCLPKPELSAMPALSQTSYHLRDEYARLKLAKP